MFNFSRRINRFTFIAGYILSTFVALALFWILDFVFSNALLEGVFGTIIVLLIGVPVLLYWVGLIRQRSNDITGKHPLLLTLFAFTIPLLWLALLVWPSEKQVNKYGNMPHPGISLT